MFKFFIPLFLVTSTILSADINFSPYNTTITKVENKTIYINDSKDFSIGSSGVVLRDFDGKHKTIVSLVEVIEKKDASSTLKYKSFSSLAQDALPEYNISPKEGDTVILNYLYNRILAISADEKTYDYIVKTHDKFSFIHPDIFASTLAVSYTPSPTKDDFRKECSEGSFALLFFAIEDSGYFVDCNSFKILHKIELPKDLQVTKQITPFYHRLKKIKGRVFGLMGGKGIADYDNYYKKLLGIK